MSRNRLYASNAERQQAYRQRCRARLAGTTLPPRAPRRPSSRPTRFQAILDALDALRGDYEQWRDHLPDSLAESPLGQRLEETLEAFDVARDALAEIELPRGFGRD